MGRVGCMLAGLGVASHDALDAAMRARLPITLLQNEMAAIKPVRLLGGSLSSLQQADDAAP
jgi:hypothetical protein